MTEMSTTNNFVGTTLFYSHNELEAWKHVERRYIWTKTKRLRSNFCFRRRRASEKRGRVLVYVTEAWKRRESSIKQKGQARRGQARKSTGRMPWHQEPKKDVTSCDKLWGVANTHRSTDFRMGKPGWLRGQSTYGESNSHRWGTR